MYYWIELYMNSDNIKYLDSFRDSIFHKKLKNSLATKIIQKIFLEYMQMIQYCVDICVFNLLILY